MKTPPRCRFRGWCLVAVVATLPALSGCGGAGWVETAPDVADRARAEPEWFVEAAWAQWEEAGPGLHAGSWRVEASRGVTSTAMDVYVLALPPASIRVSVLAPQGTTEAVLVAGPDEIGLWDRAEGVAYAGAAAPGAFGRALGLALEPADAVGTIFGYGLVPERIDAVEWVEERQRIQVTGGDAVAWLHPMTRRYERLSFAAGAVEARLADWREGEWPQPGRIELRVSGDDLRLDLELTGHNRLSPDPAMFVPERPPGHAVLPLEELARQGGLLDRELRR